MPAIRILIDPTRPAPPPPPLTWGELNGRLLALSLAEASATGEIKTAIYAEKQRLRARYGDQYDRIGLYAEQAVILYMQNLSWDEQFSLQKVQSIWDQYAKVELAEPELIGDLIACAWPEQKEAACEPV